MRFQTNFNFLVLLLSCMIYLYSIGFYDGFYKHAANLPVRVFSSSQITYNITPFLAFVFSGEKMEALFIVYIVIILLRLLSFARYSYLTFLIAMAGFVAIYSSYFAFLALFFNISERSIDIGYWYSLDIVASTP